MDTLLYLVMTTLLYVCGGRDLVWRAYVISNGPVF